MTSITVYDGANTIGGNKIYVEEKGEGLFLDFGMNFAKYGAYFQDFLKEREPRGLYDLVQLGMIPKLGIYRNDLVPSDLDASSYPRLAVKAVLLSHAHLDHCGNMHLLDRRIPVVASSTTTSMLKAMFDLGSSEVAYITLRSPNEGFSGLVLGADRSEPYTGRDFYCTDCYDRIEKLMSTKPGGGAKNAKKLKPGHLGGLQDLQTKWEISAYPVDHSLYGATSYILKGRDTPTIAYTGDLRLSGKSKDLTRKFINKASEAEILICEGTRVGRVGDSSSNGEDKNVTEDEVKSKCLVATQEAKGLTIADFAARNFERLDLFHEIAKKTGKQLVVTAKDAYMLNAIGCAEGTDWLDCESILIYHELIGSVRKWEDETVKVKWGEKYLGHREIAKNPGNYILAFSFYDMKHLLDIKPEGGTYIYSSSEAFSEEQEIDFRRLNAWLDHFGFDIFGFSMVGKDPETAKPEFEKGYHASGHLSQEDLIRAIEEIDPDIVIPVHTEGSGWFRKIFGEDIVILPEEGKRIDV